jgi:hypothetical protein
MNSVGDRHTIGARRSLAHRSTSTPSEEERLVDHDDLLALLDCPRPAHGDLNMLLRRRPIPRSEPEHKTHMTGEP